MKVFTRREEGQKIPFPYGFAWRRYDRDELVLLPIPFNIIAGTLRLWCFFLLKGVRDRELDKAFAAGEDRGYEAGRKSAALYEIGKHDGIREEKHRWEKAARSKP